MTTSTVIRSAATENEALVGPLRIAIVGAGKMARQHAVAIRNLGGAAAVVAIIDTNEAAAVRIAGEIPGAIHARSIQDVLGANRPDVVHVCTPPETHARIAMAALEAGCHVYVEKPFTEDLKSAQDVLAAAERRGLKVCAGHQLLFESPAVHARKLLPCLGRVVHVESYFSFRPVRRSPDGRTPLRADLQLLDILPHPVYLLLNFLELATGQPSRTEAVQDGPGGTVHVLVRSGDVTGNLVVTLHGRPVESYLRIVGVNGTLHADFVRSTVQQLVGPGTSGIEKVLEPFRLSSQMSFGTTRSLFRRIVRRQLSYPGLAEMFGAFYKAIVAREPAPVSASSILDTVRVCEEIAHAIARPETEAVAAPTGAGKPGVVVTGGTGFLGREVASTLAARGAAVRVLARRVPAPWDRIDGVEYVVVDLAEPLPVGVLRKNDVVIHAAAETAGGWDQHKKNSLGATQNVFRAAAAAGATRVIHLSSLAVLGAGRRGAPVGEGTPLASPSERFGPYVWGKAESEKAAEALARELGLSVKIVRPGPIVDYRDFDPPGRLGRRIGPVFVSAGWPGDRIGVVDVEFAARFLAWMVERFDEAPAVCNLLSPQLPTRRDLVERLRANNPDLKVIWLPRPVLLPLSWFAMGLQKILRPRRPAMNVAAAFATVPYDTSLISRLSQGIR